MEAAATLTNRNLQDNMNIQEIPPTFESFFDLGQPDSESPFITLNSRKWGVDLHLRAAIFAAFLLAISFIFSFSPDYASLSNLLLVLVYFLAGTSPLIESIEELAEFKINIDILMTLAAFSSVLLGSGMEGGLLLVLFAVSGSMEEYVSAKAKNSISSLHKLSPSKACVVLSDGTLIERSVRDIPIDTHILIKSGQVVPLDGIVIDGISSVNLVHLTGENLPVTKKIGDTVPSGGRNLEGTMTLRVTHLSSDSTLSRIIDLVTQAQEARPTLQRWFDRLSEGYAIAIILLAFLFAVILPFFENIPYLGFEGSIYRALAFLIAASPCALVIAIPIAYLSAVSVCARQGILLKGGITLDALVSCSVMAFDKTGTLTTGELAFEGIEKVGSAGSAEELEQALEVAYALEKNAVHPIAKAVIAIAGKKKLASPALDNFSAIPGYGLKALAHISDEAKAVYIGHPEYIFSEMNEIYRVQAEEQINLIQEHGLLIAALLVGEHLFLLRFRDTVRAEVPAILKELRKDHKLRLVMLTGDYENSARKIAEEVGLDDYYANLRPVDKLEHVSYIADKEGLAMVGDGINDAPALARATVGICMGKVGSTAAIDAADVILLHDNIDLLGWLLRKAHATQSIVKQNLFLAGFAIIIASIPALAGWMPLWLAVICHEGGTVLVGLNGLRLLKK